MKARIDEVEAKTQHFLKEDMENVSYYEYDDMLADPEIREKLAMTLIDTKDKLKRTNIKDLSA